MEEKPSSQQPSPSPSSAIESVAIEGVEGGLHFLRSVDVSRGKVIFLLGVMVYILLSFVHYGKIASMETLKSKRARLLEKDRPNVPSQGLDPSEIKPQAELYDGGEKSDEFVADQNYYNEAKATFDAQKKDWQQKYKKYKRELAHWKYEQDLLKKTTIPALDLKIARKRAHLHAWDYINHCLRFVAALLMAFGCMVLMFHGNAYEKAVAFFILGYVVVGILKIYPAIAIATHLKIG